MDFSSEFQIYVKPKFDYIKSIILYTIFTPIVKEIVNK